MKKSMFYLKDPFHLKIQRMYACHGVRDICQPNQERLSKNVHILNIIKSFREINKTFTCDILEQSSTHCYLYAGLIGYIKHII